MNLLKRTAALLVVASALGTAGCSKSSSDAAINSRVEIAIANEPALKGAKVNVSTSEKVVHLRGTVKSRDERAILIAVARKVEGVRAVKTDLVVPQQQNVGVKPPQKTAAKPKQKTRVAQAKPRTQQRTIQPGPVPPPSYYGN